MKKSKKQKKEDLIVFTSQSMVEIEHVEMTPGTMLHFHDYLEAELIVEADSMQQLNGLSINLKRGVFYIVRPMIDCHRLESKPLEIYKFYLKPGVISEALYNKIMLMANPLCVEFDEKELDMAIGLFEIMLNEQENKGTYSIEIIKSAIESLFYFFLRKHNVGGDNILREKLVNFLLKDNRYLTDVTLKDMADEFNYSETHISKMFSKAVGLGFMEEKTFLRVQHATRMLLSTDCSLGQIAELSGFPTYSVFAKAFKKCVGMSARSFRKSNL